MREYQEKIEQRESFLLFHEGKEIHRFARFVPIEEMRRKLDEMEEGLNV